jgi:hypothetical protein
VKAAFELTTGQGGANFNEAPQHYAQEKVVLCCVALNTAALRSYCTALCWKVL